jgi:hypothetical protein
MNNNNLKLWFTLIEILVWITLFSIIVTSWFYAFSAVSIWKIKLIWKTDIEKESYFFSERLFEEIKKWWLIDYEEYFNRKVVWDTQFLSWHYLLPTWFWNFGSWWSLWTTIYWDHFYYCRSWIWVANFMWTWWCYNTLFNNYWASWNWNYQRFWEYNFQFMDYNSNMNFDTLVLWDENGDSNIVWDDDDENLWIWPEVFANSWEVQELYLISWNKRLRTLIRWNVIEDPDKSPSTTCTFWTWKTPSWSWCLWTIEFLKLDLKDWWINHDKTTWSWIYDWTPETWIINPDFAWTWWVIAWSNTWNYWVPLFPKSINVKDVQFYIYPNKDINLAWKDSLVSSNFSPYLRIKYTLTPSRDKRKWMKWKIPEMTFSTTITLSDLFSKK